MKTFKYLVGSNKIKTLWFIGRLENNEITILKEGPYLSEGRAKARLKYLLDTNRLSEVVS